MRNSIVFLTFFSAAILDVSFFSRFHFSRFPLSISLIAVIIFAIYSKRSKDFFWMIIPAVVFGIFSGFNVIVLFFVFMAVYFLTKLFMAEFGKFFKKR